jgi:hypothetical protein
MQLTYFWGATEFAHGSNYERKLDDQDDGLENVDTKTAEDTRI